MDMQIILGICVGALTMLSLMLIIIVLSLEKMMNASLKEERNTAKSFIRYSHPGAALAPEEHRNEFQSKHKSLSQRQADAMESRGDGE